MTWAVYGLIDPRDGHVFYIGMSTHPDRRIPEHGNDRASSAWERCQDIKSAGLSVGACLFGEFEDKQEAKIVEGRLILSIPGAVNKKTSYGLPSSIINPGWHVLPCPELC